MKTLLILFFPVFLFSQHSIFFDAGSRFSKGTVAPDVTFNYIVNESTWHGAVGIGYTSFYQRNPTTPDVNHEYVKMKWGLGSNYKNLHLTISLGFLKNLKGNNEENLSSMFVDLSAKYYLKLRNRFDFVIHATHGFTTDDVIPNEAVTFYTLGVGLSYRLTPQIPDFYDTEVSKYSW